MELREIMEVIGLLLTNAVSFGVLKGKVSSLSERVKLTETRLEHIDDKVNDHSVTMAELNTNMTHVMEKLTSIDEKLDRVLTGGK